MPNNANHNSSNYNNTPIEVLSDNTDDNEHIHNSNNNQHTNQNNHNIHNPANRETNDTRVSTVAHVCSDPPPSSEECTDSPSSPTTVHLPTNSHIIASNNNRNTEEMIGPSQQQHLIDLIQYPATVEDNDPSSHHPHQHHHPHNHHQHNHSPHHINDVDNDNDNDQDNDNDNNEHDNNDDEALTFLPMPAYERSYRAHILRPIHAISKQQNQIAGERNAEIIVGDVRRRLNPIFRALYNSAWRHYGPLSSSSSSSSNGDGAVDTPPPSSPPAWSIPGIKPNHDVDDEPFVLTDQPGAVFVDAAAETLTKTKLLPQTIRALLKLGPMLREKSYVGGSAEDVVACIFLDFVGMMCAILRLGGCGDGGDDSGGDDSDGDDGEVVTAEDKMGYVCGGKKEDEVELNGNGEKGTPTIIADGPDIPNGIDNSNVVIVPNLLEHIGNNLLSVTARILTQEACHSGYTQSLYLMRIKNVDGRVPVDEAVRNFLPTFYRTYLFDNDGDREEIDDEEAEYLSPLRSGEWRDYYALYHPETNNTMPSSPPACEMDRRGDPVSPSRWQISRHLIAVTRYFVQEKGLESLVHLVACGIIDDCDGKVPSQGACHKIPQRQRTRKRPRSDQSRRMGRASVASVSPTLDLFRSVAFLSRFYCSNGAEYNGGNNDCLSPLNIRGALESFRNIIGQFIESLEVGIHITTGDDRQNILSILSSIETRSMTEEEWQKTSNISTSTSSRMTVERRRDKDFITLTPTVGIVPFVDFTFSESSNMKMTMLWKFLTGHNGHEKRQDGAAAVVPSLQCQIQGLNELISWLNSLDNDVREYKAQYTMDSKKEMDKHEVATSSTPTSENDAILNSIVGNFASKRCCNDEKINGGEVIEIDAGGVNLVTSHVTEGDITDFIELSREDDDNESTEVCCNSNASLASADNCPDLSSLSVEGSTDACWPNSSRLITNHDERIGYRGNIGLREETKLQSRHQQETLASKSGPHLAVLPRNDTTSYKIVDHLQKRLRMILSQLRSSNYPILEHLFSPNGLHTELLKRTLPLLVFFTRHQILQKNDIKLMWEASRSFSETNPGVETKSNSVKKATSVQLHESVTSAIFDLILGLVNTNESWILLGAEIFSYLANLFSQVRDCNWWTAQSLSIVESVVHHSIEAILGNILLGNIVDDCVVPAGMDVLWSLSQDSFDTETNTKRRETTDIAFPKLMRVVERVLTMVRDEFTLYPKKIENSKAEHGHGNNGFVHKAPADSLVRVSDNTSFVQRRLAMQRLQTHFIRRSIAAIGMRDGLSCPTATIRIMLCMMDFIPLQVELVASDNIVYAENAIVSTENILQQYDLGAILIKEMIHFSDVARGTNKSYLAERKAQCEHSFIDNHDQFYSHSECGVSCRLKLLRLTFTRCVQLHFLALQKLSVHTNGVIPIEDIPIKKRKRGLSAQRQCEDNDKISKRPIIINREDYEVNDLTSHNTEMSPVDSTTGVIKCQVSPPYNIFLDLRKLHPTPVEISKIWSSFISNGLTTKCVDHTLNLLYCLLSQDFGHRSVELGQWKEEVARTIYPLCCNLHPSDISKAGYKLLIYCLGFMNVADENFVLVAITQEQNCSLDKKELSNILLGLSYGQESKQMYTPCCLFSESEPYAINICNYEICGLSILWLIILEGRDENVADMCMVYIAVLNAYTSINSDQQISFVQRCMTELNKKGSDKTVLMKKKRMLRLIRLYTEYTIRSSRSKASIPNQDISHGHHTFQVMNELHTEEIVGSTLPYNIQIDFLSDGPRLKVYCPLGMNSTVACVRESICHHFTIDVHIIKEQWPANGSGTNAITQCLPRDKSSFNGKEFRLIFNGSELRDDMAKIGTLRIFENSTVYCCPRMCTENIKKKATHVVENTRQKEKIKTKRGSASSDTSKENGQGLITPGVAALISPTCIDSFFSLFSLAGCDDDPDDRTHLRALVWDLLQLLPTEPQLRKGFLSIGNHHQIPCAPIPWEKWLPTPGEGQSTAHFRLLYGLQLIEVFALHHGGKKIDLTVDNESPKSLPSPEKYTGDSRSSDDDVIIVKELKDEVKISASKCVPLVDDQNIIKKRAYVVMDDDDDDDDNDDDVVSPNKKILNVVEENDTLVFDIHKKSHEYVEDNKICGGPRQWCNNFVSLGGLRHLIHLFTSVDLSILSDFMDTKDNAEQANDFDEKRQHGNSQSQFQSHHSKALGTLSTLMACVNKALFLIRIISTRAIDNNDGNFIKEHLGNTREQASDTDMVQFLHHLFKMVHWAVEFQTFSQKTDESCSSGGEIRSSTQVVLPSTIANYSTFQGTKCLSSVEAGASVAIQCLFLVRMLSQTDKSIGDDASRQNHLVLNYCDVTPNNDTTLHSATLSNAMVSSVVKSPAPHVRSLALSVFRSLLCLQEPDRKPMMAGTKRTDKGDERLKSFALSILISLLPIGRGNDLEGRTSFEIISRTSVIFEMVANCLSDIWLHTCAKAQQDTVTCFVQYFRSGRSLDSSIASTITGVRHFGLLFAWLVKEVNSLNPREFRTFSAVGNLEGKHHCDLPIRVMVDSYLVGLLSLMLTVVKIIDDSKAKSLIGSIQISETKVFLHLLFDKCAFLKPHRQGKNYNKASSSFVSPQTRDVSLDLMRTLCTDCQPNLMLLLTRIRDQFYSGPPRLDLIHDWSVDLALKQKSVTGHVGMKNQGATCYMNALLQQFFHTPALREGLLSCDLENSNEKTVSSDSVGEGYKLLHELQLLFGNLLMSEKRDFETSELVKSIRGYDGNPIRPGEQQDVDEFFNLFCDRLETALKPFPQHRLLHNVFGGQLSHLITCQQCNTSSERVEDFLSISLDVKGKKNILESLDLYIQEEVLDGSNKYFCSCCKAKRESIKRCCIKTLPNVLICHLKRFEFDLETLRKVKVNDRCEFPLELNMKKYTKEHINCTSGGNESLSWRTDKYYRYNLRGVLVHTGTADSGHYYSLAQVRQKEAAYQGVNKDQWFCFNDSTVTPFDSTTLEATTFGGSLLTENSNLRPEERGKDLAKSYSAYLLIYDREENYTFDDQVKCSPCAVPVTSVEKENNAETLSVEGQGWRKRIICENNGYIRDQTLFAPAYSYFLIDLTEISMAMNGNEKPTILPKLEAIQLLTCHWLENLVHAKDRNYEVEKIISILSVWYESSLEACSWFLEKLLTSHQIWVDKILLHCYVPETRCAFVKLLSIIFQRMAPIERNAYFCEINTSVEETHSIEPTCNFDSDDYMIVRRRGSTQTGEGISRLGRIKYWKSKSVLARFVGVCLLDKLEGCDVHWRRFDQLFESILAFSSCGHQEACFLIRCGTILRLVDIYLEQNSTVPQKSLVRSPFLQLDVQNHDMNRRIQMGDKYKKPNFFPLLKLLRNLVCSAMVVPDDDNMSDSDASDTDSETNAGCVSNNVINDLETSYLTAFACEAFDETKLSYELPQRDGWQVSRPDLFEKILDEPVPPSHIQESQTLSCSSSNGKRSRTSSSEILNDVINLICAITSHVCCGNFELSLRICSFGKTLLEERKADEFPYALHVLISMLHIKDKHFKERIPCALSAICTGIQKNSAYEKETVHLLQVLRNELGNRRTCDIGIEGQAIFHQNILQKLDAVILPLIPGENASFAVKQSAISLVRSLLPSPNDSFASCKDNGTFIDYQKFSSNMPDDSQPHPKRVKPQAEQDVSISNVVFGLQLKRSDDSITSHTYPEGGKTYPHENREGKIVNTKKRLLTQFLDEEDVKDKVFSILKRIFDIICETVANQSTRAARTKSGGITMQGRNHFSNGCDGYIVDSTAFFEYFEALRICLSGSKVQEWICNDNDWVFEVFGVLLRLLWKIDDEGRMEKRPSADTTKGEIILLIEFLLKLDSDQCIKALHSDVGDSKQTKDANIIVHDNRITSADPTIKMLEMYVTNSASNADYNDRYMAHYYSILLRLAECNEEFCDAMLSHDNWRWALKSFVLSQTSSDSGKLYAVILNGTLKYVGENVKFREAIFRQLVKIDGKDSRSSIDQERIETGSIQLLLAIFDGDITSNSPSDTASIKCISHFVQGSCGGMSKLSLVLKKCIAALQEADLKQSSPGIVVLESLSLCLQCMCLTLSSFGINRVREIMQDCWPEVDDVNFMLTQIKTRTDNEWEKSYEVSSGAKLVVMQIITQASEVLTILASVEAAAQAVAE